MGISEIVFYFAGALAIAAALAVILSPHPVYSALALIVALFQIAVLFLLLDAQMVAFLQILVYAGAVMVLFLFVIMLLNLGHASSDMRGPSALATAVVLVGLLSIELATLWSYTPARLAREVSQAPAALTDPSAMFMGGQIAQEEAAARGIVGGIAVPLFQQYLVPFEITSILLLAAIVGAVVLAKRKV